MSKELVTTLRAFSVVLVASGIISALLNGDLNISILLLSVGVVLHAVTLGEK
jgi:hypothetical protein